VTPDLEEIKEMEKVSMAFTNKEPASRKPTQDMDLKPSASYVSNHINLVEEKRLRKIEKRLKNFISEVKYQAEETVANLEEALQD
jgi:hypothetical protein